MKYGFARFVYGLTGIVLIGAGVGIFFTPQSETAGTFPVTLVSAAFAGIPIVLGVLCLIRCRHFGREARRRG